MERMLVMSAIDTESRKAAEDYVNEVYEGVIRRNPHEYEYHQAVKEILDSLIPALALHPKYREHAVLERLVEPERVITFRVPWMDDNGKVRINRGFRVQFNSAIGPYKGGLRFHPTVNSSIIKFLGFEQTFKNALTGLALGGGKGGSDFDPKGKSEGEIMRFCQSFMTELYKYIGADVDVPAGDIGVGAREIGYMFGQYKRICGGYEAGVITGKGVGYGGSLGRTEATGYGCVYFVEAMLKDKGLSFAGSTVVVSGSGNVSTYAMEKAQQLGAKVIACSDSDGYVYDPNGINLETVKRIKDVERQRIKAYVAEHPHAQYVEGCEGIWSVPCDIALPCATQNEINDVSARVMIQNGVKAVGEGANMPTTLDGIHTFLAGGVLFAPAKAANAGGVAVSGLEMSQNSMRLSWTFEDVDDRLKKIMRSIYENSVQAAEQYGCPDNLVIGANIAGFKKVADAMLAQGLV